MPAYSSICATTAREEQRLTVREIKLQSSAALEILSVLQRIANSNHSFQISSTQLNNAAIFSGAISVDPTHGTICRPEGRRLLSIQG
jgi:hypothetical protein